MGPAAAARGRPKSIGSDGALRELIATAIRLGVAPKRLQGWEPSTTVEHEYDSAGRLARSIETREVEWDEEQRLLVLAYREWKHDRGPHGHSMREATSPDVDPTNRDARIQFVADELPLVDYVEKAKQDRRDAYMQQYPNANMNGLIFPVRRIDRDEQ